MVGQPTSCPQKGSAGCRSHLPSQARSSGASRQPGGSMGAEVQMVIEADEVIGKIFDEVAPRA